MNIDRLDLIAYGHLTDVRIDLSAGPNRFHVIVGKNESGKSTSMRAIDAWLYGFPGQTTDDYVHPMKKLRVGGVLRDGNTLLHCIRRKGNRGTVLDGADGKTAIDDQRLLAMLGGVDRNTFGTQFLIDHDELVAGGQLILQGEGELGEALFAAGAGLGRLKKIQDELKTAEEGLLKRQGRSNITDGLKVAKQLRADLKEAQVPPAEYARLQADLAEKQSELQALKQESESLSIQHSRIVAKIESLPIIPIWLQATSELSSVADAPILPDDFSERRRELATSITLAESSVAKLTNKRQKLCDQRDQIGDDSAVLDHRDEIESLVTQLPVREKGETDRTGFMANVLQGLERDLRMRLADLAKTSPTEATRGQDVDLGDQVRQYQLNETQRNKVGRLAGDYTTLVANLDDGLRQVNRFKQRIENTSAELQQLPKDKDTASIAHALNEIDSPANLAKTLRDAVVLRDRQQQRCASTRLKLRVDQSLEDLMQIRLPDPTLVSKTATRIAQCDDEVQIAKRQLDDLRHQLADDEAAYEATESDSHLPSQAELQQARETRDAHLAKLLTRSTVAIQGNDSDGNDSDGMDSMVDAQDGDIDGVMQSVRKADQIVDQLRLHQKEIAQREAMLDGIRRSTAKIGQAQKRLNDDETNLEEAARDWQALWLPLGIEPQSPDAMKDWCDEHERLVEQTEILRDLESAVAKCSQTIDFTVQQLCRAMNETEIDRADSVEWLMELHAKAKTLVDQQHHTDKQRDLLRQRIAGWESELAEAESTLADRRTAMDAWQVKWDAATESLSSVSPTPDDVLPMLDAIKDLSSMKKERDDMLHRRTSIESETLAFLKTASRLLVAIDGEVAALKLTGDDSSVLLQLAVPKIQALNERSKRATSNAATRQRLAQEIKQTDDELQNENVAKERDALLVRELCREADCEDFDKLPEIEARSRQRQTLIEQVRGAEMHLKRLAGNLSIQAFVDSVGDIQEGVLQDQLDDILRQRKQMSEKIESVQRELGSLEMQVQQIDGGESASDISQALASQMGEIRADAEEYIRLRLARSILRQAIDHYRDENQQPVLKIAETFFRQLTGGNYIGLKVDYDDKDKPVLQGVRDGRDDVPASGMSKGTADSLYLALRLASLQHRCEAGKPMPLIVDDCLQQLDDERATAAMKVFSQLSRQTQVIMFTHHEHLVGLAENHLSATEVHLHRLTVS